MSATRSGLFMARVFLSVTLSGAVLAATLLLYRPAASAAQGDCSQPVSVGTGPVASDCLFILSVAVALQVCTPAPCVCDPTGDANTTANDALTCLKSAVGEQIVLQCPCGPTTTNTPTTTMPGGGSDCTNDGNCFNDDCVCPDCDQDFFCADPDSCDHNGTCHTFTEGCACADCATHPECLDN